MTPSSEQSTAIQVGTRVRHGRTGLIGVVARMPATRKPDSTVRVDWEGRGTGTGGAALADLHVLADSECAICGDTEPFHVHHGNKRIEDYFTVGRGQSDLEAARAWRDRALAAENKLARIEEPRSR